jgi:hypothetical protein
VGAVPFREVECLGKVGSEGSAVIVSVTLYNFSKKQFLLRKKDDILLLELFKPEDLLE